MKILKASLESMDEVCKNKLNNIFPGYWKGLSGPIHCGIIREILKALAIYTTGKGLKNQRRRCPETNE